MSKYTLSGGQARGLRALLELSGMQASELEHVEQQHRTQQLTLANGVIIRDQKPMPPATLERCLQGMTPPEWYALLNTKVFFWLDIERLNRMLKANNKTSQVVMILDTAQLLAKYAERVTLTPLILAMRAENPHYEDDRPLSPMKHGLSQGGYVSQKLWRHEHVQKAIAQWN